MYSVKYVSCAPVCSLKLNTLVFTIENITPLTFKQRSECVLEASCSIIETRMKLLVAHHDGSEVADSQLISDDKCPNREEALKNL